MVRSLPRPHSPALFLLMLMLAVPAAAQVPRTISFQGLLADATGKLVDDGVHRITVRLYDSPGAASAIYSEVHDATVVRGVFNVIIGSRTPLPESIGFDRAYFLGVSIGTAAELAPRTPLTATPYALRAAIANDVAPSAPLLRSLNGRTGDVVLQGGGATTVTQSGSTITISSSGGSGGTGIQGVQNADGSLTVTNPNGPVASIGIADSAITGRKLARRSVGAAHLGDTAVHTAHIANGSITAAKLAGDLAFPPGGPAGGDLSGNYPNPAIATGAVVTAKLQDLSVTTAKLDNDAVTSAKIANGTIMGADINTAANISVASLSTTGAASIGTTAATVARLTVQGAGTSVATTAFDVTDNTGTNLFRIRDNGSVGIGVPNPTGRLEIGAGAGIALQIQTGQVVHSNAAVPAGPAIILPPATNIQITDDGVNGPNNFIYPIGTPGQIMYITNDDANAILGPVAIAPAQTRHFIYVGGRWRLVN